MFGINIRQLKVMEYQYSPVPSGKVCVAVGILGLMTTIAIIATEGWAQPWALGTLVLADVFYMAWGVYCWKVRRKPLKFQITLGGPSDRLYRRNRWLFAAYSFACCCVEYAVVVTFISLLDGGTDIAGTFMEKLLDWLFLLLLMLYRVFREYMSYYQYYHTPEGLHRDLFAGEAKPDLYTEAVKLMKDGKEGK